jgi:uncharacterized protein (DUF2141 family)
MRSDRKAVLATLALSAIVTTAAIAQSAGRISVTVTGLRNDQGSVRCGLYASADGFRQPGREFRGVAVPIKGQRATCVFGNIPSGSYAVAVFHAERNETQMEYGMFGKPKQGYGFSRNPASSFGPPSFAQAAFEHRGGTQAMQVQLHY